MTASETFQQVQRHLHDAQIFKTQGRLPEAIASLAQALAADPNNVAALFNLGNAHKQNGAFAEALASYQQALGLAPDSAEVHFNVANLYLADGKHAVAVPHLLQTLKVWPNFAPAHSHLALAQDALGQVDAAMASHQRALALAPQSSVVHVNLGRALVNRSLFDRAERVLREALSLEPASGPALACLAHALQGQGRVTEATPYFEQALALTPNAPVLLCALAENFNLRGQVDTCCATYDRCLAVQPGMAMASSNLLFLWAYRGLLSPHDYVARARHLMAALPRHPVAAPETAVSAGRATNAPQHRLRVGYISGDFRHDAVSYFIAQVLAQHDRARIELVLYNNTPIDDGVTAQLKQAASEWYDVRGMADSALVTYIRAHKIDVLIDLSGHVAHNRLGVLAHRVAPVQAHYLGYFASTGLAEMDYWIADDRLVPPEANAHFSETVWRLPRVWVSYQGRDDAPLVDWRPDPAGVLRLGSFNNLAKISDATLSLWARVLQRLPKAILVLKTKSLEDAVVQQRIVGILQAQGVNPARLELLGRTESWMAHMAQYNRLDLALDPVGGVGGGTTTCDALWMGVPVVTLQGETMAQRMTASMLEALGHAEWIATSEDEYLNTATALAADVMRRQQLRPAQREKMRHSALCDAKGLARALEDAYFAMHARVASKADSIDQLKTTD